MEVGCGHRSKGCEGSVQAEGRSYESLFQQVTNTEAPWENGATERHIDTIDEQYELAQESFEPKTG